MTNTTAPELSPPDSIRAIAVSTRAECDCYECARLRANLLPFPQNMMGMKRMHLCTSCGNKRCPKATNHKNKCSGSNLPNQKGSIYF